MARSTLREMTVPRLSTLTLGMALAISTASAADAEIFSACSVMPTPDGFVALRDRPSPTGRLITKMHPGEIVVIDVKDNKLVRVNGFARVSHYPGEAMPLPGEKEFAKVRRGWAKDKLVDECG